ncbi:MAG: Crp/Fnr family transcriptional regulator [Myxococcota bacterium]
MADKLLIHKEFLRTLPETITTALEARAVRRRFADGDVIFRRGDPGHGLLGVVSGRVQVLGHGADGREFVLTVLSPGEWFGELSFFDGLPRTHDNVAIGDTELFSVESREVESLLRAHPEFWPPFAELMSHRVRMLFGLLEDSVLLDLPTRLAKRLLQLAGDHGEDAGNGGIAIDVHLPQEDLAAMVGATREAVGRHLKRFEREGFLEIAYGRIVLRDPEGLSALLRPRADHDGP